MAPPCAKPFNQDSEVFAAQQDKAALRNLLAVAIHKLDAAILEKIPGNDLDAKLDYICTNGRLKLDPGKAVLAKAQQVDESECSEGRRTVLALWGSTTSLSNEQLAAIAQEKGLSEVTVIEETGAAMNPESRPRSKVDRVVVRDKNWTMIMDEGKSKDFKERGNLQVPEQDAKAEKPLPPPEAADEF